MDRIISRIAAFTLTAICSYLVLNNLFFNQNFVVHNKPFSSDNNNSQLVSSAILSDNVPSLLNEIFEKDTMKTISCDKKAEGFEFGSWGGFYSFDEILTELDSMRLMYPHLITVRDSIGRSVENRAIWAVKISDNPEIDEDEPEIFYNSLIHGVEPMSMMVLIYYMYHMLENYGTNPEVTYLLNNRELYFIPVVNPDGFVYGRPSIRGYRKNRRDNGDGTFGVDLNRNFGYMWGCDDVGSDTNTASIMYRGPAPFSEPETISIRDFCNQHEFLIANSLHYYGYWMYRPWSYNDSACPDSVNFDILGLMSTELNNYIFGPAGKNVNGVATDWLYGEQNTKPKIFAFTTETGGRDINIISPSLADILKTAQENVYLNQCLAWGPGIIHETPYLKNILLNTNFIKPDEDTLKLSLDEINEFNSTTTVWAFIKNSDGDIIDSINIKGKFNYNNSGYECNFTTAEEDYYDIEIEQTGLDIPFKFYYKRNLNFTSLGPVDISVDEITQQSDHIYNIKFIFINMGNEKPIRDIKVEIFPSDPSILSVNPTYLSAAVLNPGVPFIPRFITIVTDDNFDNTVDFDFRIYSDDILYWKDSLCNVLVDIKNELSENYPEKFQLYQNYPNPFNSRTTIKFSLPSKNNHIAKEIVTLKVYDTKGSEVAVIFSNVLEAGEYTFEFNANNLTSGVYYYRLSYGKHSESKKMLYLK